MNLKEQIENYLARTEQKPYQLADIAGVPRSCIYRYLAGTRDIRLETATKVLEVLYPENDEPDNARDNAYDQQAIGQGG